MTGPNRTSKRAAKRAVVRKMKALMREKHSTLSARIGAMRGTVKWFDDTKGYGFITQQGGGKDVFVHYSAIVGAGKERRTLNDGDIVEFEVEQGPKGDKAKGVILVERGQQASRR